MALDQYGNPTLALNDGQWGWDYGTGTTNGTAPSASASTRIAPWQYGQGTNYATGLQNTLQPMMQTMYPNGYLPGFSESFYLANNPDVRNAIVAGDFNSALQHYQMYGQKEGRSTNPVVNRAMTGQGAPQMNYSPALTGFGFDPQTYLQNNPDVAAAVKSGQFSSPLDHYLKYGAAEGRGSTPFQYSGQTLFNQQMPNQYRQRQGVAPNAWRGMTGSPFGSAFQARGMMPMLSYLGGGQGSRPAQQAPQSFQVGAGTQTSRAAPRPAAQMNFFANGGWGSKEFLDTHNVGGTVAPQYQLVPRGDGGQMWELAPSAGPSGYQQRRI